MSGVRLVVGDYMDYATVHGIGRIKNSPCIILKIFWFLAMCVSFGMIIWQVIELYAKYKSSPVSTSVEINSANKLEFPTITICNTNPAQYSKLRTGSTIDDFIERSAKKFSVDTSEFNSSYGASDGVTDDPHGDYPSTGTLNETAESDILSSTAKMFKMLLSITDDAELVRISQNVSEFIIMCNFLGQKCTPDMFTPIRTYQYGLCYNFDPYNDNRLTEGKTAGFGPDFSLELLLYINQDETLPFVTTSSGIAMLPNIYEEMGDFFDSLSTVFIPTGFEANVGLKHVVYDSVPGKETPQRCSEDRADANLLDCRSRCIQKFIANICGCYQYYFMLGTVNSSVGLNETFSVDYGYGPCYTPEDAKCIIVVNEMFITNFPDECGNCVPHCKRTELKKDVSMFTWPNAMFIPVLERIMNTYFPEAIRDQIMDAHFVKENLALVRVYLSTLTYEQIKEEYSYSVVNLLSDVGGQLGLWAGFSVLSILEVLELGIILLARFRKAEADNRVTDVNVSEINVKAKD